MKMRMAAAVTVALVVVLTAGMAEGQSSDCASKLLPCADYLNSTKPSAECCNSIKTVITTQLTCLCGLIKNPEALAGINLTQALELPKSCSLSSDTSVCNAPAPSALPPPATPGGNGGNSATKMSWMGMPALLLASAFTFFY